jgi:hypothetical protein
MWHVWWGREMQKEWSNLKEVEHYKDLIKDRLLLVKRIFKKNAARSS